MPNQLMSKILWPERDPSLVCLPRRSPRCTKTIFGVAFIAELHDRARQLQAEWLKKNQKRMSENGAWLSAVLRANPICV